MFEVVHGRGHAGAAYEVEPLLDVLLVLEVRVGALSLGREEEVEVELVELTLSGDAGDVIGDLVGHEHHAGQRLVGVVCPDPVDLAALLVGVGPVEDLLLDELAGVERAERRAREVEVEARLDGQPGLVELVARGVRAVLDHVIVLLGEEALGGVAPRAEVVLVEDDHVPVLEVHPLVLGLYAAGVGLAEVVLERAEADDGPVGVAGVVLELDVAGHELPALEVHVGLEVGLPGVLDGGLEREHEQTLHAHALGELVGGEGRAEAHLGVPEERGLVVRAGLLAALEVGLRLLDGLLLLGAHVEVLGAQGLVVAAVAHLKPGVAHVVGRAAEPLAARPCEAVLLKALMDVVVGERGAVGAHGALGKHDLVGQARARLGDRKLLRHAPLDVVLGEAHLEQTRVVGVLVAVGVDRRVQVGALGEEGALQTAHHSSPLSAKGLTSESMRSISSSVIPYFS